MTMAVDPTRTYPSADYYVLDGTIPTFEFAHLDVKQELINALKEVLPKYNFSDVKVIRSDPQTPTEIPCIGINRANDDETSMMLTDTVDEPTFDKTTGEYRVKKGTFFAETIEIRVWHTNADQRDKLYPIVKATCVALREPLTYKGLRNINLRGGKDEQDTEFGQAPVPIYWASILLSFLNPLDVDIVSVEQPIAAGDIDPTTKATTTANP